MNLIQQVEAALAPIGNELMAEWNALESKAKSIGAMIWADAKVVGNAVESTVVADLQKMLPAVATQLQAYAVTLVQDLEQGAWGVFSGQTKFGVAVDQLIQVVGSGVFGPAFTLAAGTAQSLIQDAYATFRSTVQQVTPVATPATPAPAAPAAPKA